MPKLRMRFQFQLNTWLVFESVPLFELVLSPQRGTTVVVPPPKPLDAPPSMYAIFLDQRHTHESSSILMDVIMEKKPHVSLPDENSSLQEVMDDENHEHRPYVKHARAVAGRYAERLIELLRWRTGQSWVGLGGHRSSHSYHYSWAPEGGRGALVGQDQLKVIGDTPVGLVQPREDYKLVDEEIWRQVAQDLSSEVKPELQEKLLLDAHYFLHAGNQRRCTLESAIACELYGRRRIGELASGPDDPVLKEILKPGNFVERYMHLAPYYLKSRSLKDEDGDLWRRVKELFKARNDVAHALEDDPDELDADKELGKSHLKAAYDTISWLASI